MTLVFFFAISAFSLGLQDFILNFMLLSFCFVCLGWGKG
jgi:hypothetical protein